MAPQSLVALFLRNNGGIVSAAKRCRRYYLFLPYTIVTRHRPTFQRLPQRRGFLDYKAAGFDAHRLFKRTEFQQLIKSLLFQSMINLTMLFMILIISTRNIGPRYQRLQDIPDALIFFTLNNII